MVHQTRSLGFQRRIKHAVASTFGWTLQSLLWRTAGERFFADRINIIFYHGIWPTDAPELSRFEGAELGKFDRDLRKLKSLFDFVGLAEILKYNSDDGAAIDRPLLAVCFDDGCDMMRTGAVDVLDSLRIPATMFVVTSCIDNRHLMWMHKLQAITVMRGADRLIRTYNDLMAKTGDGPQIGSRDELTVAAWCWPTHRKEEYVDCLYRACDMPSVEAYLDEHRPYMTWQELGDWNGGGHAVGLHTHTHPFCDRLAPSDVSAEITEPAQQLRRKLGIAALPFAYPFGNRLAREREAQVFKEAGLSCMLGVEGLSRRGTDPCRLDRVSAEDGLDRSLFGKPFLEAVRQAIGAGGRAKDDAPVVRYRGADAPGA